MAALWRQDANVIKTQSTTFTVELCIKDSVKKNCWLVGVYMDSRY